ncbi:hypothetical protein J4E93_004987 [Alternaria ventricosa]|uniref:uncharacterized protein n=1 Tax=Alternaria ventricosa TaxID=1187951 RepID=UPI0020C3082F|nr:uncharacterized protein J4E93_004987 [Alternaria ventricosa]KAI4646764.1 hypothetical protein J4E93_004987 [Alternaria ventricosa]
MAPNDDAKRKSGLTIAQVKFKQAMKDSDAEDRSAPIAVEISSQLFNHIDAVLQQNSPINIQKCTEWIVKHVAPSKARITTLGAYLIAVSKSVVVDQSTPALAKKAARNRMDLLLIVNDALHADKFHRRDTTKQSILGSACQDFVPDLIELAAACITEKGSQLEVKLKAIVNYWAVNKLLGSEGLKACRHKADEALSVAQGRKRNYVLPEYHGDRHARWHDLPASYMLEPIIRNPNRPIHESQIKIRKFDKKPVSSHVRTLLDNFFENIDLKYLPTGDNPTGETTKYRLSLDPMGQLVKQDKETGETATVANGYGWSPKFCQDIQKFTVPETIKIAREDIERMEDMEDPPVLSVGRRVGPDSRPTSSSSESGPPYRERRRGYNRSRSRSHSRRSPGGYRYDDERRRMSPDGSMGRRRVSPHGPPRRESEGKGFAEARPSSRAYDREESQPGSQWGGANRNTQSSPNNHQHQVPPLLHQPPFNQPPFPPPPHMSGQFQGQFPMPMPPFGVPPPPPPQFQGRGGFVPPPPPPNFNGMWQPPPPNMNMPPNGPQHGNQGGNQFGNHHGSQGGNRGGNQFGNQGGNQYGNNFGPGNNGQYGQSRGGYQGGRGYGGGQRGGNNGNRGGWRGNGRGGRY